MDAYILAGIESDHECSNINEAREKLRKGMHVMIREGTHEKNLKDLIPLVNEYNSIGDILAYTDGLHFCCQEVNPYGNQNKV